MLFLDLMLLIGSTKAGEEEQAFSFTKPEPTLLAAPRKQRGTETCPHFFPRWQ